MGRILNTPTSNDANYWRIADAIRFKASLPVAWAWGQSGGHEMILAVLERADELKRLCVQYDVRRLYLFGSGSKGLYDPDECDI